MFGGSTGTQEPNIKFGINIHHNKRDRLKAMKAIKSELEDLLKAGYSPYDILGAQREFASIDAAFHKALQIKKSETKETTFKDYLWIYCTRHLSLIEVWPFDIGFAAWPKSKFQKNYTYGSEEFLLVFTQNNISSINDAFDPMLGHKIKTEAQIMDEAWQFFKEYLVWEDSQVL